MLLAGVVWRKGYAVHMSAEPTRDVQKRRAQYRTVLDDPNAPVLFRYEEPPAAVSCVSDVHGLIETGDGRRQRDRWPDLTFGSG